MPTCLPLVQRRCHACASERFRANGKFRVNANHKLLDAWLLVLCVSIPVRPVRLIAEGCGLSRADVERLIAEGKLVSSVRLSGELSGDFTFTLKR